MSEKRARSTARRRTSSDTSRAPAKRPTSALANRAKRAKEQLVTALAAGSTRSAAAGHAGVSRDTLYRWLREDETFAAAVEKAESSVQVGYEAIVRKASIEGRVRITSKPDGTVIEEREPGDWKAAAWWLERRRPDDYHRRSELTGKDGGPITTKDVTDGLDDHEKELLAAAIREELARRGEPADEPAPEGAR